jgi:hypothetical protein
MEAPSGQLALNLKRPNLPLPNRRKPFWPVAGVRSPFDRGDSFG